MLDNRFGDVSVLVAARTKSLAQRGKLIDQCFVDMSIWDTCWDGNVHDTFLALNEGPHIFETPPNRLDGGLNDAAPSPGNILPEDIVLDGLLPEDIVEASLVREPEPQPHHDASRRRRRRPRSTAQQMLARQALADATAPRVQPHG